MNASFNSKTPILETAKVVSADQVDAQQLYLFLQRLYPPVKSEFLHRYGQWWHGGNVNRWVILIGETIVGYCAVIPTKTWLKGVIVPALWWVDLVIDPTYRGLGYQSLFDDRIRKLADLKLGFPNELAAKIHRKHKWGVREDLTYRLLPLEPTKIRAIQSGEGLRGKFIRVVARVLRPITAFRQWRMALYLPASAREITPLDGSELATIFHRYAYSDIVTTYRDAAYFKWRYLDSPYREQLTFYIAGPQNKPTHYLIARHIPAQHGKRAVTRILDLFGDFQDSSGLKDIIQLAAKDAVKNHSVQVTMMVLGPELGKVVRNIGFWGTTLARFCWFSTSVEYMRALYGMSYWTIGDSDNDEPA